MLPRAVTRVGLLATFDSPILETNHKILLQATANSNQSANLFDVPVQSSF